MQNTAWACLQEGKELDKALAIEEKERQLRVRNVLNAQKQELAARKQAEMKEEQDYAEQEKVGAFMANKLVLTACLV